MFIGDAHNQVRKPANRKDDFHETYNNKVDEVKRIAKEEGVSAIIQAGDFLNSPQYNNDFIVDTIQKWSFVPEKYELLEELRNKEGNPEDIVERLREDIPYIGVVGNHELIGESYSTYPRTSLAFMERLGFMRMVSKENPVVFTTEDGQTVAITGTNYHSKIDEPDFVDDYIVEEKQGDVHIHFVHGYLTDKNLGPLIKHTLVDAVKDTKADITLSGHDHIGFKQIEIDGKLFANPGALTRTKADVKEIARQPKVLIIEIANGKITMEERLLTSAPKGEEVLDRTSILAKAEKNSKIESIKSIVNKAKVKKGQSVTDIIEALADTEGLDKDVTDDVIERVTNKIEEMGGNQSADVDEYKLTQVVLENFQSHEHSVFDIADGLNVFTGESSNGKSALMRAMRWLMDNHGKSQRESFIRHGTDFAKVTALFDNGMKVSRVIHSKAHRDNGWVIYDPIEGERSGNTHMLDEVRELFGYTKVQHDTNDELDVNFMNQGDGWYFIGDHVTASKRAKAIGAIFGTHYTDAVMKDLERELRKVRQEVKIREEDLESAENNIKSFDYLEDVEALMVQVQALIESLQQKDERKHGIDELMVKHQELDAQKKTLEEILDSTANLDDVNKLMDDLTDNHKQYGVITQLLSRQAQIIADGQHSKEIMNNLSHVDEASNNLEQLQKIVNDFKQLSDITQRERANREERMSVQRTLDELKHLDDAASAIERMNKQYAQHTQLSALIQRMSIVMDGGRESKEALNALKGLDEAKIKAQHLSELITLREQLEKQLTNAQRCAERMDVEKTTIDKQSKIIADMQEEYKELLDEHGACPTCGQVVDEDALASHLAHSH